MKTGIHFYEGPYLLLHNKTKAAWDKRVKYHLYSFIFKSSLLFSLYKSKAQQHKYTRLYPTY